MRDQHDATRFATMLRELFGLYPSAKSLSPEQTAMFFRAVAKYPLEAVQAALDAHVKDPQRGRFPPVPADVVAQLEARAAEDGRPGADEAWAIALRAADEAETVVWTAEMAQAWELVRPVIAQGDEVGARMAFRDAYTRLVAQARAQRQPAQWTPSLGFDTERRAVAMEAAVRLGRMAPQEVAGLLPAPEQRSGLPSPRLRELLRELRNRIADLPEPVSRADLERAELKEMQAQSLERVERYAAERGIPLQSSEEPA